MEADGEVLRLAWQPYAPRRIALRNRSDSAPGVVFDSESVSETDSLIRFTTYDAAVIARVKYIERYHFVLWDSGLDDKKLDKLDVVLAFPDENMPFIKNGVVRRQSLADEGLRPIEKISKRTKIKTEARLGSIVECVMRNGLVVVGEKVWDSRFYMVLRVGGKKDKGGKILIAYKHALLDFHVLKEGQKRKKRYRDDWDDENMRRG